MGSRNKCWQYYTTQNDRTVVFKLHFISQSKQKTYTIAVKIYTTLQYRLLQYLTLYKPPHAKE